jgi:hypothetical protein
MTDATGTHRHGDISRRVFLVALGGVSVGLATATTARMTSAQSTPSVASPTAAGTAQDTTPQIVAAANAFLATLSDAEQETVLFDWTDTAQKQRWSNFPSGAFERAGLMWGDMGETTQGAWLALMQVTLSAEGYKRVLEIWHADDALAAQEDNGAGGGTPVNAGPPPNGGTPPSGGPPNGRPQVHFGAPYYYAALIGTPSATDPWQWQFGGHHLAVNATVVGPNLALTPSFLGAQPGTYTDASGNAIRPLGDIEADSFALINALDATQQQAAILGDTPIDLVLGPGQDGRIIQPEGLPASQMSADQQAALLKLIGHYASLGNEEVAAARMAEIESTLGETYLAWYGPTTPGSAAYFRITGQTLTIEYAPQGDPQGDPTATTNHIHGIYRDPTNDYGARYTGITIEA